MELYGNAILNATTDLQTALSQLLDSYEECISLMERAPCEKTRLVSLYMNYVDRWHLCNDAVRIGDWAVLEVEGCDWLPFWAAIGKPQYNLEMKRRMEQCHDMTDKQLEYFRMNRFIQLTAGSHFISHDDFCEQHNAAQKNVQTTKTLSSCVRDPNICMQQSEPQKKCLERLGRNHTFLTRIATLTISSRILRT